MHVSTQTCSVCETDFEHIEGIHNDRCNECEEHALADAQALGSPITHTFDPMDSRADRERAILALAALAIGFGPPRGRPVWEIKLIPDGAYYGHTVTAYALGLHHGLEPDLLSHVVESTLRVRFIADTDPEKIGYKAGDTAPISVHELDSMTLLGHVEL